ncbi:YoaK family protein [Microbacterium sp. LWH13-1.2]|uniref:YoaK family protein n=1 Tax=Microbacterium sp. LWH13-1.2 TaxID=3135260 RepID=UPI00313894CF
MSPPAHALTRHYPLLETAPAAVALALVSGLLNAWTFGQVGTFATVQSGNLLSIGYFLADGNHGRVLLAATSVVVFAFGAFVCSIYVLWRAREDKPYSAEVLVFELVIVALLAVLTATTGLNAWAVAWTVSFIAGVQGNAFHRETGMLYGNIAVTSVVQMAASLVARALGRRISDDGEAHMRPAGAYFVVLVAFVVGGGTGFGIDELWAGASLATAAAVLLILFIAASSARGPIDPAQNNPTP